jgi:hypothetical protein
MILIRDIFQLKFGKAKDALTLWREGAQLMKKAGHTPDRVLTDLVGNFYTLVVETTTNSLSEFEATRKEAFKDDTLEKWYQKFIPLVESGRREIFNIID